MDFYQSNNDSQQQIPSSFRSFSKTDSPSKLQRGSNLNENRDFYAPQSDMSSPSRIHFQAPTPENSDNDSFKVFVRVRPLDSKEQVSSNPKARLNIVKVEDNMLFVLNPYIGAEWSYKPERSYVFTKAFDQDVKTVNLYEEAISSTIKNVLNGFNSTILAYGMTGAGKTFTMFGDIYNIKGGLNVHPGIASLLIRDLFRTFERETDYEFKIKFSYLEIYNEHARDLLANGSDDLMIVEDSDRGIVIPNLSEFYISSHEDIFKLILQGNSRRIMASTHANQFSSRSHAIMQIVVEKRSRTKDIVDTFLQSKLCLVDLAGSERAAVSENRGLRHREGANINRSLLALGNCINILSDPNKKGAYVPYRDSKLTRLLKDSLGGNTQTVFLACISPSYQAYEESVNTLKYASRARNIQKKVVRNVKEVELHISEYKGIIESLREEVDILKQKLSQRDHLSIESTPPKEVAAEYANKVNAALDELGKRLVNIFEENWEYTQSLNELRELKVQNEELLKTKVFELGRTVGDIQLYNRISDEIVSLKEVMANNEKIQKENEINLERSNIEKKSVQSQIFWIISHNPQSSEEMKREICLEELERDSPLLNLESPTFRRIMHIPENNNEAAASRIHELLDEVHQMKKQIAEKDKLLIKNQEVIHSLLQTNSRPEPSTQIGVYPSPSKEQNIIENRESARWTDLTHRDEELKAIAASARINNIPATAQMTSISNINIPQGMAPNKDSAQIPVSFFSQASSVGTLSKDFETRRGPGEQYEQMMQGMTPTQSGFHSRGKELFYPGNIESNKLLENPGDIQLSAGSLDDLNNFTAQMNRASLDSMREDVPADEKIMYQAQPHQSHYMNEIDSPGPHPRNYRLSEQPLVDGGDIYTRPYPKSLTSSTPYIEDASRHRIPKSPNKQNFVVQPNTGDSYSPNLSSIIGHTQEQSGDGSFKDLLSENLNVIGRANKAGARATNKENVQKRELSSPKTAIPVTSMQNSKLMSQKSPNRTASTSQKKFSGTSSPDTTAKAKSQKFLKNIRSPNSGAILTKSLMPNSPERQIVYRSQERALTSSLQINSKQDEKFKYCKQDEVKSAKRPIVDSAKEKYDIKTVSSKSGNGGNRNQPISPFIQSSKNMAQTSEYKERNSIYTISDAKNELKSLDTRRELVKGFRTKLHQFATVMDNNTVGTDHLREIKTLIEQYKQNPQAYPLSAGDANALQKLEHILLDNKPHDLSGNEWEISEVARTRNTIEPLDDSAYFDEGERAFGNLQLSTQVEKREEEEKRTPVQIEAKAIKHHKYENEQKLPIQTKSLGSIETPKQVDKKQIISLYVAFGFIIMAFLWNIISRLSAE